MILDTEVMSKLFEFGGLIAYQVRYFDPITQRLVDSMFTFNQDTAIAEVNRLRQTVSPMADVTQYFIKFDGKWGKE